MSWYWKTSESENWQLGELITQVAEDWSSYSFDLSSLFSNSTTFQIAFQAKSYFGRGITLDEVLIHDDNSNTVFFEEGFEQLELLLAGNFSTGAKMIGVSNANSNKVYVLEEKMEGLGDYILLKTQRILLQKLITGIIIILVIPQQLMTTVDKRLETWT